MGFFRHIAVLSVSTLASLTLGGLSAHANVCPSDGSTATDATFECLKSLPSYGALPAFPTYYFSSEDGPNDYLPQGDDANPCTQNEPCRSVEKMGAIAANGQVHLIVDVDHWDDFEDFDPDGVLNGEYGIGYSFSSGPDPCGVPADEACVIVSGMDATGTSRPTFDCSIPAEANRGLGDGVARNNAKYPNPPRLTGSGAFLFANASKTTTDHVGWLAVENVIVKNCPEWATNGSYNPASVAVYGKGKISLLNVDVIDHVGKTNVGGIWGADGNVGRILLINVDSSSIDVARFDQTCVGPGCADPDALCDGSAGSPAYFCKAGGEATGRLENFWDKGLSANIVIGSRFFQENTQYEQSIGIVNGKHHLGLYGSEIFLTPNVRQNGTIPNFAGVRGINFENESGQCHGDRCDLHLVDTTIYGLEVPCEGGCLGGSGAAYAHGGRGVLLNEDSLASSDVGRYRMYRSTITDTAVGVQQINLDGNVGPAMDFWAACLILDEMLPGQFGTSAWQWRHNDWIPGSSVTIVDSILDEDDAGIPNRHFNVNGTEYGSRAATQAAYAALSGANSWFEDADSVDSGGIGFDGDSTGSFNPCQTPYADLFVNGGDGSGGYVPAFVTGQKLVGFSLQPTIPAVPLRFEWLLGTLVLGAGARTLRAWTRETTRGADG